MGKEGKAVRGLTWGEVAAARRGSRPPQAVTRSSLSWEIT